MAPLTAHDTPDVEWNWTELKQILKSLYALYLTFKAMNQYHCVLILLMQPLRLLTTA